MSDWKTLHFFDSEKYNDEVVPKVKGFRLNYSDFFDSDLAKYVRRNTSILELQSFIDGLTEDLKKHKVLDEIEKRTKKRNQPYQEFVRQRLRDGEKFSKLYESQYETYSSLITFIVFKECASFNPHFILGRRIFGSFIETKTGSIAEEVCSQITQMEVCIGESYSTFTNWITREEAELLLMDFSNVKPKNEDSFDYFKDFKVFLETAVDNSLGLIAGQNMHEGLITLIEKPLVEIELDIKKLNLKYVIEYK